ncbi:outer membrane protein [Ancylobacter radicis]|uniref:Outer membrane protein beta-barrel domain-containing protein n=1 Tax=Ancylobacter radicis TaxID=2836179 RepID=A0ABS5R5R1_9HYPH|nr:hypothetical protein [Ancylobacter radicis]MBS9476129.1 hypothetical protein [Ancylobacter radicis]
MKTVSLFCAVAGLAATGTITQAQVVNKAPAAPVTVTSLVPDSAFFIGAGGSINSTRFTDQTLYAQGVSTIYQNGVEVGSGWAGGPMSPGFDTSNDLAGAAQLGYFQHIAGTNWLWGAKFTYNYVGGDAQIQPVVVPQVGAFTGASPSTFTGNVVARSYSTSIDNQFGLVPFIGRSFDWGFLYLGAGPTLSRVNYTFNDVVGLADINGVHYDITGRSDSYSASDWAWGGEIIVGATYFLTANWFVDFSYSYAMTETVSLSYAGPFSTSARGGFEDTGILSGTFSGATTTQAFTVSINRAF